MSVLVTLIAAGDPRAIERLAQEDPDRSKRIIDHAKSRGLIAHRFHGSEGKCMVIDEWPDAESFQKFVSEMESEIGPMMQQALTGESEGHLLDEARDGRRGGVGSLEVDGAAP